MKTSKTSCRKTKEYLVDWLGRRPVLPEVREHFVSCPDCASELASMESMMRVLDEWRAPDPEPFLDAKWNARLRLEKASALPGIFERLRDWIDYGTNLHIGRLAAGAVATLLVIGAGTLVLFNNPPQRVEASDTVRDLQWYDSNAQLIQQLSSLDSDDDSSSPPLDSSN
ncbi:MAG TPA: hypothetical protein VFE27_10080 [Acidobacteriaceae bacterium]|nr:hypothetical protein [Acidobacteriaceae bacterium]